EHRAFYDLPFHGETLPGTTDEHIAGVRERLQTAVTRQMVSDVPVGAFLSGGVDSSAIVSMMRSAGTQGVRCYTIGFDGQGGLDGHDEDLPYARLVAKHFGVELEEVEIQPDIVDLTERMVYLLDEPQADPACINVHLICEQAARDGYKVLLSGAGGDDIFSGYRRHAALQAERWWSWLPTSMRRMLASASNLAAPGSWWGRNLQKAFRSAPLPAEDRLLSYFLWAANNEIQSLYSPQVRDDLSDYDQLAPLQETIGRIPNESNRLNRMLYLETKHFLPDHNLNYVDKMSMAHGVEVRVPLLDLDLVNYVTSLPPHEKQRGTQGKWIFKKAVAPLLPNAVLRRSKTGFGAPLRRWIR
ncbi:MAG: asparagine synthase C-terminal domain-containing protein, partial [Pirellulaceae bacterium]|nr:asparagine synthase C-terminal domain-containing protein [Pirellulaceae bacterium]